MSSIFSQVLNMSLTGSVVILLVILARSFLKDSPKIFSYALWSVVLFRLLCPVSITAPVSVLKPLQPESREVTELVGSVSYLPNRPEIFETDFVAVSEDTGETARQETSQEEIRPVMTPMHLASVVWLAGAFGLLLYSLISYIRLRFRLVGAAYLKNNLYLADRIETAFVLGLFRPKIYLPSNLPLEERRFIIAHERHHIRRGDHIIKRLAYLALCIHWFNPLVWIAFLLAGKDMEMSCDEAVIQKLGSHIRADYSATLLRLSTGRRHIAGTVLSFGEGDPKGRIRNMANWKKPKVWASMLCVILCLALLIVCGVNPQRETGIKVLSRDSLGSCKAVLETLQSTDNCLIRTFQGESNLSLDNYTGRSNYWKAGPDWMLINATEYSDSESVFAYLYRDGIYYDNVGTAGVENGHILWNASSDRNVKKPWLASFQWEPEKVQLLDRWEDEEGTHICLKISDTITDKNAVAEEYTVEFLFSTDKTFHQATLRAKMQEFGTTRDLEIVMFAALWEAETIENEMEMAFRSKLPPLTSAIEGQTGTYGALSMTLPEGYSWMPGNGTGLLLYKNGALVGGVTHWNTPEDDEDWINSLGLWDAMSGASYFVMHWDSGKTVGASFVNEANRGALNHDHTFYVREEIVYNVWFNENLISQEEGSELRKTISISDRAPSLSSDFGGALLEAGYEDLTDETFTEYLQQAYGLESLTDHRVYHKDGAFQVEFLFDDSVPDWQLESAEKFALDKFYSRDTAKYDVSSYDLWLIEHRDQKTKSVVYRIFVDQELRVVASYPEEKQVSVMPLELTALPKGYGAEYRENGSIAITRDGISIGCIDVYEIPAGALTTYDPYFRWLESLGIPDYQDESLCYSGGGSLYGDWDMHFESDVPPGVESTVNRYHTFFVAEDLVYDVWFDLMVVDGDTRDTVLTALTGTEPYMETQPSDTVTSEEALEKCRSVLDAVQAGPYRIYAEENRVYSDEGKPYYYTTEYLRHGDDWLRIHCIPVGEKMEKHASMNVDGKTFNNVGNWAEEELIWSEGEASFLEPWLATYSWNEATVSYLGYNDTDGLRINLCIHEPFPDAAGMTDHYYATFHFDGNGNFQQVVLETQYTWENGVRTTAQETEYLYSTGSTLVSSMIDTEYRKAMGK